MKIESLELSIENLNILKDVSDPEIPVLSVLDLGIVRTVTEINDEIFVRITPTYSGCPAMDVIGDDIVRAFAKAGKKATVSLALDEAWTTDWMTEEGKRKLEKYGVAAPLSPTADKAALLNGARVLKCTNCSSTNTQMISQFGSTACKAMFKCDDCLETFDYFKCLK